VVEKLITAATAKRSGRLRSHRDATLILVGDLPGWAACDREICAEGISTRNMRVPMRRIMAYAQDILAHILVICA
jgi:hypothetical protein